MQISGKQALITGASSGIGAAIARELAGRGAEVTLVARGREAMEELAHRIASSGGIAHVEPADLSRVEEVEALARRVLEVRGAPDILVNNAGAGRWLAVDETPPGEAQEMIALPYLAAFETTRAFLPEMIDRGSGQIVCMTSVAAFTHLPGAAGYGVARWAMRTFANQLRADLRGTGLGVTLIAPSEVDSPYFDNNPGARERIPGVAKLLGRSTPETVARYTADAIERDSREVIVPRRAALVIRATPKPLVEWLTWRTGWKRR